MVKRIRVHRKGFTFKKGKAKGTKVAPTTFMIKDRGALGRGKKVIPVKGGKLTRLGYSTSKSTTERHRALRKAVKRYGALSVFRMLNAHVILRKRSPGKVRDAFVADRNFVKREFLKDR